MYTKKNKKYLQKKTKIKEKYVISTYIKNVKK